MKSADEKSIATASNAFALELYSRIKTDDENLFFSPVSIVSALAMVYAGARGETASQMERALRFTVHPRRLHRAFETFSKALALQPGKRGKQDTQLTIANALWVQTGYTLLENFVSIIESHYGGTLFEVDFRKPAEALERINRWVDTQTQGKILEILKEVNPLSRLIITNAIYFLGKWDIPFEKNDTKDAPFTLASDAEVTVPMMHQEESFSYLEQPRFQALQLPYQDKRLTMVIFLPRAANGLPALEEQLSVEEIEQVLVNFRTTKVKVFLPRFRLSETVELPEALKAMGMGNAFSEREADFSGITSPTELSISQVIHKAYIEVDEEGTEAAAVTAVVMRVGTIGVARKEIIFRVDHPFLFLIYDSLTKAILFLGRVMNPKK